MIQRVVQFCLIMQLRNQKKKIKKLKDGYWMVICGIQVVAFLLFLLKKDKDIICSYFWIDSIVLIFQLLFYKVTYYA